MEFGASSFGFFGFSGLGSTAQSQAIGLTSMVRPQSLDVKASGLSKG